MSFDTRMGSMAFKMIAKYGKTVTYTRTVQGAYDVATGIASATATVSTFKALVQDYTRPTNGLQFEGGTILNGDKHISVAAGSIAFTPAPGDIVTVDLVVFTVLNVRTTYAGERAVVFDLHVRT